MQLSTIIWLAGTIALSIFANAIWELAVRPLLGRAQRWITGLLSLGSQAMRNALYREASGMSGETIATRIFGIATGFMFSIALFVAASILAFGVYSPNQVRAAVSEASVPPWIASFPLVLGLFLIFSGWRTAQARSIASHFQQRLEVVQPLLTPEELALVRLGFAIMRTETEYLQVHERLSALSEERLGKAIDESSWVPDLRGRKPAVSQNQ